MPQITHGLRAILSHPLVYGGFQRLMGSHKGRSAFVKSIVKPVPGMTVLDLGCGPGDMLAYLPEVDYWGFDMSEEYIKYARRKFGTRGRFHCKLLEITDLDGLPKFDVVFALGVLHHLDDDVAGGVARLAHSALKPGGRFLTFDPCLDPAQHPIARFLVKRDRGQNVRDVSGYETLVNSVFSQTNIEVHHDDLWIPYTICYMVCTK